MAIFVKAIMLAAFVCTISGFPAMSGQEEQEKLVDLLSVDEIPLQNALSTAGDGHIRNKRTLFEILNLFKYPVGSFGQGGFGGFGQSYGYSYPSYNSIVSNGIRDFFSSGSGNYRICPGGCDDSSGDNGGGGGGFGGTGEILADSGNVADPGSNNIGNVADHVADTGNPGGDTGFQGGI